MNDPANDAENIGETRRRGVDLQLNVYNLLDKKYIASLNNNRTRYTPGAPRTANLTANFTF